MELDTQSDLKKRRITDVSNIGEKGLAVNLYRTPPFGQLTLEECEDLFRQRLEALYAIEKADVTGVNITVVASSLREIKSYVYKTNCILLRATDVFHQKLDHFSHMLVRMFCIYNANLWEWFKKCEKKLLYYRLRDQASSLSGTQLEAILRSFQFNFERVIGSEMSELYKENLVGWNKRELDREVVDVFKVKFTDALRFIAKRSVSLKGGYAFLSRYEIMSVVCDVFEKHLDDELNYARQHLNLELLQTQQLLDSLSMVYLDYQERIEEENKRNRAQSSGDQHNPYRINLNNLKEIIERHYPPCMRYMHEALLEDHHLKHQARLYYGAFLRSGGVDMDSAIEFWRQEFTKKIPNDRFERDYKYNIRHLYGKEGHKKALSCFTCDKIINDNAPGPSEKHGCPFRHFDDTHLRTMLTKHNLKEVDIESILHFKNDKEYKLACSHYFKFLKGDLPKEPIRSPIHYYYESMNLANRPKEVPKEDEDPGAEMTDE